MTSTDLFFFRILLPSRFSQHLCAPHQIIVLGLGWYLGYSLSDRDLEEMMRERGLKVDHSTIARWVLTYAPELEKRLKPQLKPTTNS